MQPILKITNSRKSKESFKFVGRNAPDLTLTNLGCEPTNVCVIIRYTKTDLH
jgi:hypothetical protein